MTTLITGAGLIGCLTAANLVKRGEQVVLLDMNPSLQWIGTLVPLSSIRVETVDVRDRNRLEQIIRQHGVSSIIHTAAALSSSIRNTPTLASEVNFMGTINLVEAALSTGVRRLVVASSTTVYYPIFRRQHIQEIGEDFNFLAVSERPTSLYAASKLAIEFFLQAYADQWQLEIAILRYSAVLGLWAGPTNSVPGRLLELLLGKGAVDDKVHVDDPLLMWSGGEDFIDARDVATANVAALNSTQRKSKVYTISSGRMTCFKDFINAAKETSPWLEISHAPLPEQGFAGFPYPRNVPFDVSLAEKELGFRAKHDVLSSMRAAQDALQ
jgi:UDP-glucose 4-epimerase